MKFNSLAKTIARQRALLGLTRNSVAKLAGLDPSYITYIEKHGYIPVQEKLRTLCAVLFMQNIAIWRCELQVGYLPYELQGLGYLTDPQLLAIIEQAQAAEAGAVAQGATIMRKRDRKRRNDCCKCGCKCAADSAADSAADITIKAIVAARIAATDADNARAAARVANENQ